MYIYFFTRRHARRRTVTTPPVEQDNTYVEADYVDPNYSE